MLSKVFILFLLSLFLLDVNAGNCLNCARAQVEQPSSIVGQPLSPYISYSSSTDTVEENTEALERERQEKSEKAKAEYFAKNKDKWILDAVQSLEGDAGPSIPKKLPTKVTPNQNEINFFVNNVLNAIKGEIVPFKDAFTLVTSSNNIFQKITSGFLLPRLEGDTFLELVYNKAHNSCNYLLRNRHMKEDNLDRRSLQILFDHGGYDVSQGNRSGHIHQQRTQEQGLSDNSIKKDKMNARVYCHVGAYLAMCKLFAENVIDEERKALGT